MRSWSSQNRCILCNIDQEQFIWSNCDKNARLRVVKTTLQSMVVIRPLSRDGGALELRGDLAVGPHPVVWTERSIEAVQSTVKEMITLVSSPRVLQKEFSLWLTLCRYDNSKRLWPTRYTIIHTTILVYILPNFYKIPNDKTRKNWWCIF